jgi:glyoxylase-like metal-dependent hydrolase (beta-lactamase superfamily II)
LERGWLSSNNVLCEGREASALVDSGYFSHQQQTVALVQQALDGRPLDLLVNTHLHSDHCGGNAALQHAYPDLRTTIPPGQALLVADWDPVALSYVLTGQNCPQFSFDSTLVPGSTVTLGDHHWQIFSAPGHDPNAVVLFEPTFRTLISGDALWQNGFGVIFPEIEGESGFAEVGATLDLIESLAPLTVIPGHGPVFSDVTAALAVARKRLEAFVRDPRKHALHAGKVLVKFKLLELQRMEQAELLAWARSTPYFNHVHSRYFSDSSDAAWIGALVDDLVRSGAARRQGKDVLNA